MKVHDLLVVIDVLLWGLSTFMIAVISLVSGFQIHLLHFVDRMGTRANKLRIQKNTKNLPSGIMHVFGNIYLTFVESDMADSICHNIFLGKCVLVQMSACNSAHSSFAPSSLTEIFRFDEILRTTTRHNPGHKLVICTSADEYVQAKAVFLTGCHLIMTHGLTSKQTSETFKQLQVFLPLFDESQLASLPCCWNAVYRAKCMGWIDFGDIFDIGPEDSIFIEEYIHYARQIKSTHPHLSPSCHQFISNCDLLTAR